MFFGKEKTIHNFPAADFSAINHGNGFWTLPDNDIAQPLADGQQITATISTDGRFTTAEEFENIILRASNGAAVVRLGEVARVEIGAQSYATSTTLNGKPMAGMAVQLATGANALATADSGMVAEALAAAIRDEAFDLVLTGLQSDDQGFAQTGVVLAELLGISHATIIMEVQVVEGGLRVKRELEGGWFQWVSMPSPALLTIQSGINQLRYATLRGIMAAKNKTIDVLDLAELGIDPGTVGWAGARQEITDIAEAPARDAGEIIVDEGDAHERILAFLDDLKVL